MDPASPPSGAPESPAAPAATTNTTAPSAPSTTPASGTTPYDRARALAAEGLDAKAIRKRLEGEGVDAETATLAASAVAGKAPMDIDAFGEWSVRTTLQLNPLAGPVVDVGVERGTFADAVVNLVGGIACIGFGFALVVGWALGHNWSLLMFGLMLVSLFRFRWYEIGLSALRIAIGAGLVACAFIFGENSVIVGAFVAVIYGLFWTTRGWFAFRLFEQRKLGIAIPELQKSETPAASASSSTSAEPPVPSP